MKKYKEISVYLQSNLVQLKTFDQKDYLVAPCIAIVEGVLNQDLILMEVVKQSVQSWNGRPVVLNHPLDGDNLPISANHPDVLESFGMGQIFNARVEDDKFKVDIWLDQDKADRLGGEALATYNRVKDGLKVEVSTGFWAIEEKKAGIFGKNVFEYVVETIFPDHLALLPNAVGACSIADGCGAPRTMVEQQRVKDSPEPSIEHQEPASVDGFLATIKGYLGKLLPNMTAKDKFRSLATLVAAQMESDGVEPWAWHVEDVEDDFVIVWNQGKLLRKQFSENGDGNLVLAEGEWEPIQQQTRFVPNEKCQCQIKSEASDEIVSDDDIKQDDEVITMAEEKQEQVEQKDTLAEFLNEIGMTKADVVQVSNHYKEKVSEYAGKIIEYYGMSKEEAESMPLATLEKLADKIAANVELEQPTQIDNSTMVYPRGFPTNPGQKESPFVPMPNADDFKKNRRSA